MPNVSGGAPLSNVVRFAYVSHILEILAEVLLTPEARKYDAVARVFVAITMTVAGICFLGLAAFALIVVSRWWGFQRHCHLCVGSS
jgi:hypothetical protein